MNIWVYTDDFISQGIVDTANSVIWANRFRECGDFEIYASATVELRELLQVDRFVTRDDDSMIGVIEHVEIGTDVFKGEYIIASGRSVGLVLGRRIVWDQTAINGKVELGMRKLVTDALISPTITARKYDRLTLAPIHGYQDTIQAQFTGDNLQEAIEKLCSAKNYGYKITRGTDNTLVLDFYKGVDRSKIQDTNPRVIFSEEYDNLTASRYIHDKKEYKTVALVAGEGEGAARRKRVVGRSTDQSGLHRRELYVDARDVSSNDGEITDTEYNAMLDERGDTALAEAPDVQTMEGSIEPRQLYTYKVDYDLGDVVTVINKYGIEVDTQVLEVVEVWDENGYTCTPTFG